MPAGRATAAISQRRLTLGDALELLDQKPGLEDWTGVVTEKLSRKSDHRRRKPTMARLLDHAAKSDRENISRGQAIREPRYRDR